MDVFIFVAIVFVIAIATVSVYGIFVPDKVRQEGSTQAQIAYRLVPAIGAIVAAGILTASLYWIWTAIRPNVVVVYSTTLKVELMQIQPGEVNVKFVKGCNVHISESNPVVIVNPFALSTDLSFNAACSALNDVQQQEVIEAIKPFNGKRVLTTYTQARIDMPTFSIKP